jgi:pimeloyl-ACP methyl ester carboxylesterase
MISGAPPIGRGPLGTLRAFRLSFDTALASKENFSEADVLRFGRLCFGDRCTPADLAAIRRADGRLRKIMFGSMMRGICADEKQLAESSTVPLAVVNGLHDALMKPRYIAAIRYRSLWDGVCHVIPDGGHDAFRAMPDAFNPLLMRFANDVSVHRTFAPARREVLAAAG